jgi:diadenosine tetraphosphate (Ap4A) HIT family hydrolase
MNPDHILYDFKLKFRVDEFTIYKNNSWTWSLRPAQPTLGSGILSLNRYALHLSEVTDNEMKDLGSMIFVIEKTMKKTFDYDIMNYLMLMMVDHHVHYHVIPRYKQSKFFGDLSWIDNAWPGVPAISDKQHNDHQEIYPLILTALKHNLVL